MLYYFGFFLFILSISPTSATHISDPHQEFRTDYELKPRLSIKLDLEEMNRGIQPLIQKGFTEQRAREVYAHPIVIKIFEEHFEMWNGEKAFRSLGSFVSTEFDPKKRGRIDDIFMPILQYDVSFIMQVALGQLLGGYTEIHWETKENIRPCNLFHQFHQHSFYSSNKRGKLTFESERPCGETYLTPPFPGLLWNLGMVQAVNLVKNHNFFKVMKAFQTYTLIEPDGSLTIYEVVTR